MVGRLVIGLLVLMSALVGATAGLLIVYSTDLPQVGGLDTTGRVRSPSFMTTREELSGHLLCSGG